MNKKGLNPNWNKGKNNPMYGRKGILSPHFNVKKTEEHKQKIKEARKKQIITKEQIEKTKKTRIKNGGFSGKNNGNWKGGITPINAKIRNSFEYKLWRNCVFERDKYTCRFCGVIGGQLNADHIKPFSLFPELRFAIDNGRTLCIRCHKTTDTYAGKNK